jgi:hypothetical protein
VFVLQMLYNGDSEEGAKKFERFVNLGPVMNKSETIRECSRFRSSCETMTLSLQLTSG